MENSNKIIEELKQVLPVLANAEKRLFYAVPANYFEGLSDNIMNAIAAENLQKTALPFSVQVGYFENLSSNILAKINNAIIDESDVAKELEAIAPLLNIINKENIYSVSQGYFNSIDALQVVQKPVAKVVSFSATKMWLRYGVAACIIGILATGAFIFTDKNGRIDYAAYKKIDIANSINNVSSDELINYLENVNSITNAHFATNFDVKLPEINDNIKSISDEELKLYLNEADLPLIDNKDGI
ncbi:MAG: hypothetical protein H7068_01335 [Pedobacter sp.]|nr:hypothetical protein [Chitinophagaceae bacterium]